MNRLQIAPKSGTAIPQAIVKKDRVVWVFSAVPIAALMLCVWFLYHDFIGAGPRITIYFKDAEGLEEKNTPVMHHGVTIGEITRIRLTPNDQVEVKARLFDSAKQVARVGSVFWVVHPDIKVGSISGLKTLVSGEYIDVRPGNGPETNWFIGQQNEPVAEEQGALHIILTSPHLGSLQEQSPIFYRGIHVGDVLYYQLAIDSQTVVIHARILREYAPLVHADSRFWNAGGIDVHFGLFKGMQINAESPKTIVTGGIEFATPPDGIAATNGTMFALDDKEEDKWKTWSPRINLQFSPKAEETNLDSGALPLLNK